MPRRRVAGTPPVVGSDRVDYDLADGRGPGFHRFAGTTSGMSFPDLAPWFDTPADAYEELPSDDHSTPYDE